MHRNIATDAVNQVKELLRGYQDQVSSIVKSEVEKPEEKENAKAAQDKVARLNAEVLERVAQALTMMSAPKRILRDSEGRASGLEPVLNATA